MKGIRILAAVSAMLLGAAIPSSAAAAPAGVDDFTFESFDANYTIDLDGQGRATMRVVETIVALFPPQQNRGIIRAIPLKDGEYDLDLTMVSITDGNGTPWHYERDDYDGFAEFALGTDAYLDGRTTFVLEYTMRDPVRHYLDSGGDEFYWDVNGNGWAQSFGRVSAHVEFGPQLAAALTGESACYLGYYGEAGSCELTRAGSGFDVSVADVAPYNTVTVSIGLTGGTVAQPALPRESWVVQVAPKALLGVLLALLLLSISLRTLVWRDARGRSTVIAEYTPPDDSDLLLDADIIGRSSSGLPALFVDFAVRGLVRVVDHLPGEPGVSGRKRFSLVLVTADGATARELGVLSMVFGIALNPGKDVRPGMFDADVGASLSTLGATAASAAVTKAYRAKPRSRWMTAITRAALVTLLLFIPIGVWAVVNDVLDGNVVWPAIGSLVLAIAIPSALAVPPRLTERGADLRDHLRGIKLYLTVAEEERLRMLQSPEGAERIDITDTSAVVKLYERLLPYAVLWGVEDQWVGKLQALYPSGTPEWLDGDAFDSTSFSSFTTSSTSAVHPIVSTSSGSGSSSWSSSGSSSSSSGSSGGGFSGGGGGGGGGGGR